jgi:arginine decarboxylase
MATPDSGASLSATRRPDQRLDVYYMASRLRSDTWDELKNATGRIRELLRNGREYDRCLARIRAALELLRPIESYWAFPGKRVHRECERLLERQDFDQLGIYLARVVRALVSDSYRRRDLAALSRVEYGESIEGPSETELDGSSRDDDSRPYFEVLLVDDVEEDEERELKMALLNLRRSEDPFVYDVVVVRSFEDALIGILFNHNVQSVVIRYGFPFHSSSALDSLTSFVNLVEQSHLQDVEGTDRGILLGEAIKELRPELDVFLVTDAPVEVVAGKVGKNFRRIFYRQEDHHELHQSILKGISERFESPFFTALKTYAQKPTGVFHAMPISRGKSILKSHWIRDIERFYGSNIFMAETSATAGGLDSLLQPMGPLKKAQKMAARAFHARQTYFVTNGTSTANKIVMQAIVHPGDIVLVARDCHKSHHYSLILSGARPVYLDSYPLSKLSMYGAVPLREMKRQLLHLRRAGKLDEVRMVLLTNCTFDGIAYDAERVMEELLAIKPDLIFLWDEAWYAFASFTPLSRRRTAMWSAQRIRGRMKTQAYRDEYENWNAEFQSRDLDDEETWLSSRLMPDPDRVRVRVYATQSTHKTLTALRQGSMIHVFDQDFERKVSDAFHEAYMTHTSTSPNYQILASLDVGRRQVELEGYELVQKSIELAMTMREQIQKNPLLRKYFRLMGAIDMVPDQYRPSGLEYYFEPDKGWSRMEEAWLKDEFVLDPTRVTLHIGRTGMDGDEFKSYLIDRHDIQINKTSRNTVLFMIHIGMTRGTVAYLIEVLTRIAQEIDHRLDEMNATEKRIFNRRVESLTDTLPPLPNFSRFHPAFQREDGAGTPEADMREAFFLSYDDQNCEYVTLGGEIESLLEEGDPPVSASFVTPYPPGFPILVPGQVISREILDYLKALDVKEIHGYRPEYGLRVFNPVVLATLVGGNGNGRKPGA